MGQKISFATTNWKNKPDKPDCYTQAEWDARNSSKFNGAPFASRFAVEDIMSLEVMVPDPAQLNAYKNAIQAISLPSCPFISRQLLDQIEQLPTVDEITITLSCEDIEMKVWDGSTYYDLSQASKTWNWNTCGSGRPRSLSWGYSDFKAPSARSDVYVPVCGPGTHITEITREEMMDIVWKISQFDLQATGFSVTVNADQTRDEAICFFAEDGPQPQGPFILSADVTVAVNNKNLDPQGQTPGQESNIVNSQWDGSQENGYKGSDSAYAQVTREGYYADGPYGTGNGNVTVSASISPQSYECGVIRIGTAGSVNITMKSFNDRNRFIYFVTDSEGVEKIYFDPTGLFNFFIAGDGLSWYLDPTNAFASHTLTLNFLGKNYTLKVSGPPNGTQPTLLGAFGNPANGVERTTAFSSGTITITPKKYYPYANSAGEAVYDEDTGEQLVDPLS